MKALGFILLILLSSCTMLKTSLKSDTKISATDTTSAEVISNTKLTHKTGNDAGQALPDKNGNISFTASGDKVSIQPHKEGNTLYYTYNIDHPVDTFALYQKLQTKLSNSLATETKQDITVKEKKGFWGGLNESFNKILIILIIIAFVFVFPHIKDIIKMFVI